MGDSWGEVLLNESFPLIVLCHGRGHLISSTGGKLPANGNMGLTTKTLTKFIKFYREEKLCWKNLFATNTKFDAWTQSTALHFYILKLWMLKHSLDPDYKYSQSRWVSLTAPVPVLLCLVPGQVRAVVVAIPPAFLSWSWPTMIGFPLEIIQSQSNLIPRPLHCAVTLKVNKC